MVNPEQEEMINDKKYEKISNDEYHHIHIEGHCEQFDLVNGHILGACKD